MFKNEYPEIKVSYTKFYMLKPKNVKNVGKTPLLSSLCPYCLNIRLKLQILNIPELKMEYHLFNKLICNKNHIAEMENANCISKTCEKCNDWENQIETLLSVVPNQDKDITWYTWKKTETTKNGKITYKRDLVKQIKPFSDFGGSAIPLARSGGWDEMSDGEGEGRGQLSLGQLSPSPPLRHRPSGRSHRPQLEI